MKLNYADRRTDKNILKKRFKILDSEQKNFKGKISLIEIEDLEKEFKAKRPDGKTELIIAKNYKLLTYFPKNEKYCMTVMYNDRLELIQWYFDIGRYECNYDSDIPYSEDFYLDLVVLPDGSFFTLDENEFKDLLNNNTITLEEYTDAYETLDKLKQMIQKDFNKLCEFTKDSFKKLIS